MDNKKRYKKLISEAASFYKSTNPLLKNIQTGNKTFDMLWCPGLKNEINLWSYWQGKDNLNTAKILLVGKDFGNYGTGGELSSLSKACIDSDAYEKYSISEKYIKEIQRNKSNITDNNLIRFFNVLSEESGQDFNADKPNDNLFFTNLCLGYRSIPNLTGSDLSALFAHDVAYLKELLSIIHPQIVILLGQDVGISTIKGLVNLVDPQNLTIKHTYNSIKKKFNQALDKFENHVQLEIDESEIDVFVVSHPGHYGVNVNRNGGYKRVEDDWRRIGAYIKTDTNWKDSVKVARSL